MKEFFLYTEVPIQGIIKEIFKEFEIHTMPIEIIKKNNFINKNILLLLNESLPKILNEQFFVNNNVVIFFSNQKDQDKNVNTKVFNGNININKFKDDVTNLFISKEFLYSDIKICGEKIINTKTKEEIFLTTIEKNILTLLIERNKIEKIFFLEDVLSLRIDTETKTVESHLTRIRKKLYKINSQIKILSKDNSVFLVS